MTVPRYQLAVDFGTSNTVAVLDGRPLLFDGVPVLPSAVCHTGDPQGGLLVGRDAVHAAGTMPQRFEPHPKRRVDDGVVLLGDAQVPVVHLIAAVLRRVADEARAVTGGAPFGVTLTYPVAWAAPRQEVLRAAARAAGLGEVRLVPEPVAAAAHFAAHAGVDLPAAHAGADLPAGACAVVYDIGAGTFDVSVVRRDGSRFEVVTADGLDDGGGLDLDAAVVAHLGATYATRDAATWNRLVAPATPADARAARTLWDQVRTGREMLSRASTTYIHLPLLDLDAPLGREEFDALAGPVLDRTIATTVAVLGRAGIAPATLGGVFLVGGASRSPLVATLLHRALGVAPRVIDQPELAVAHGALIGAPQAPRPAPEPLPDIAPAPAKSRRKRRLAVIGAVALVLAVAAALLVPQLLDHDEPGADKAKGDPSTSSSASEARSAEAPSAEPSAAEPDPEASPGQQ